MYIIISSVYVLLRSHIHIWETNYDNFNTNLSFSLSSLSPKLFCYITQYYKLLRKISFQKITKRGTKMKSHTIYCRFDRQHDNDYRNTSDRKIIDKNFASNTKRRFAHMQRREGELDKGFQTQFEFILVIL